MSDVATNTQIVFLIDVNENHTNSDRNDFASSKIVNTICLSALRLLLYFASTNEGLLSGRSSNNKCKQSSLKWGFKFYNSSHHHSRIGGHVLRDFKLRYFEEFENEIERKFEETQNEKRTEKKHVPSDCLRKALMEVIYDFQWEKPDITSPVKPTRKSRTSRGLKPALSEDVKNSERNLVFLFSKFPQNQSVLRQFAGKKVIDADVCLDSFMPQSLRNEFYGLYQLRLFWIDCYNILIRPGVDLESLNLFEETLNKIGGNLIPAEFLVQFCHKYVSNVASFFPNEASIQARHSEGAWIAAPERTTCHQASEASAETCKSDEDKQKTCVLCPVLPRFSVVDNVLRDWQRLGYKTLVNNTPLQEMRCQLPLLTKNGEAFCELEIVPMQKSKRHESAASGSSRVTTDVNVGESGIIALETDICPTPLLVRDGVENLCVCAVLREQTWSQLTGSDTERDECVCTAIVGAGDKTRSMQFEHLLVRLLKQESCLVLEVKGHASLVILKPLTTASATLSCLSLGRSLALEKALYRDSVTECGDQSGEEPGWAGLVSRLNNRSAKSSTDRGGTCFNPSVTERNYLPGCPASFGRLLDKLSQRISQLDFLNKEEQKTLIDLQKLYRYDNQPSHNGYSQQGTLPQSSDLAKDRTGTNPEENKKSQGCVPSRGEMMVTRSRQAVSLKGRDDQDSGRPENTSKDRPKSDTVLNKADFSGEEELMSYLHEVYTGTVCDGNPTLTVCAQTIVTVSLHYIKESQRDNPEEHCQKMLEPAIIVPLKTLREKYINCSTDVEKQRKIREYRLQVILRLECESMLQAGDVTDTSDREEQIVNLLRTLGFVTDPTALSEFMTGTLVDQPAQMEHVQNSVPVRSELFCLQDVTDSVTKYPHWGYVHSLPHLLGSIYDELMQPLPMALEAILSPNHSADQSVLSQSLMSCDDPGSNMSGNTESSLSQPPSAQADVLLNRTKPNTRRRTLVHHPSLAEVGPKRQIMVKKVEKKKEKRSHKKSHHSKKKAKDPGSGEKVCRNLFENKRTKLERRQSVAVMEGLGRSRHRKRHPSLKSPKALKSPFKSPTLRYKKVSETPAHKQKCQALFSRIEKERHRSKSVTNVEVVEESPVKSCTEQRDSPSQRKRAMALLRRSFYSAGPTKRSRNLTKSFQLADRIAGRVPVNRLRLGSALHDTSAEFKSPDKNNSSLIFSQLMGSPTPPKSTPNKLAVTPAKYLLESPSLHTRSKSPGIVEGTPRKYVIDRSLLESPCMNTRSKSPGFSLGHPKILFREGSFTSPSGCVGESVEKTRSRGGPLGETPVKGYGSVAESPSQNTRSKGTVTPQKASSRAKMFLFKSPENRGSLSQSSISNISSSKCLNLSQFEAEKNIMDKEGVDCVVTKPVVSDLSFSKVCELRSTPQQEVIETAGTSTGLEKTPSPRKRSVANIAPTSLDKWPRKKKFHNILQSPKMYKVNQSPTVPKSPTVRQSPRISKVSGLSQGRLCELNRSPNSSQPCGKTLTSILSPGRSPSHQPKLWRSPRTKVTTVDNTDTRDSHHSKSALQDGGESNGGGSKSALQDGGESNGGGNKSALQDGGESNVGRNKSDMAVESPSVMVKNQNLNTSNSTSQEHEAMDTDNESIFSELSQESERKETVNFGVSSPFLRKRSLNFSPDNSSVFSPSKRRRLRVDDLEPKENLRVSYCLHSRMTSRTTSFGSCSSQTSLGFPTGASSQASPGFPTVASSQASQGFPTQTSSQASQRFPTQTSSQASPGFPTVASSQASQGFPTGTSSQSSQGFPTQTSSQASQGFPTVASSQASQGIPTGTFAPQSDLSMPSLSQSSLDSNDYFSLSNDDVFLSMKPKLGAETCRAESPVFGSAKKNRPIIYSAKPVSVVEDLSTSSGLASQDNANVLNSGSPHVTRNSQSKSASPYTTKNGLSVKGTTRVDNPTKLSPSSLKYSPSVSARSLMHLINSPLMTSPDSEDPSPRLNQDSLNVRRRKMHGKSKRSLNLHN